MNRINSSFKKEGGSFMAISQPNPKVPPTNRLSCESMLFGGIPTKPVPQYDRIWLEQFSTHIHQNFSDSGLRIPDLAERFTTSESSLLRRVKRLTGLTPAQFLRQIRLQYAMTYLQEGTYDSIREVAYKVGYQSIDGFSRKFKQQFHKLPSELLNSN
ncbi:MAG: helix-turn-helix domain-containing protein [Bacteroidota bacterium]